MSGTWRGAQREKTARCGIASCCRRKAGRTGQHRYRRAIGEERGSRRRPLALDDHCPIAFGHWISGLPHGDPV
jgi:hypothetical protein